MKTFLSLFSLGALTVSGMISETVAAQDNALSVEGYIGGVTDYRDRGLSLSDFDPALTGSVGFFHSSGFYAGADGALLSDTSVGIDGRARLFGGYSIDRGDYIYDFSVEVDSVHGNGGSAFFPEFKASVARDFGLAYTKAGFSFAPDGRWSNVNGESYYFFGDIEVPVPTIPSLTIVTHLGHDIRSNAENLWDWSAGLSYFIGDVELAGRFEKSSIDSRIGNGRFIFGVRYYF